MRIAVHLQANGRKASVSGQKEHLSGRKRKINGRKPKVNGRKNRNAFKPICLLQANESKTLREWTEHHLQTTPNAITPKSPNHHQFAATNGGKGSVNVVQSLFISSFVSKHSSS